MLREHERTLNKLRCVLGPVYPALCDYKDTVGVTHDLDHLIITQRRIDRAEIAA